MKRSIFLTAILVIALSLSDALAQSPTVQYARSKLHERGFVKDGALLQEDFIEQCVLGNTENVKLFILAGADPNAVGHRGRPALLAIVDQNYTRVREDHEAVLEILISSGANLEVRDNIGRTAFVIATLRKNIGLLEVLLRAREER